MLLCSIYEQFGALVLSFCNESSHQDKMTFAFVCSINTMNSNHNMLWSREIGLNKVAKVYSGVKLIKMKYTGKIIKVETSIGDHLIEKQQIESNMGVFTIDSINSNCIWGESLNVVNLHLKSNHGTFICSINGVISVYTQDNVDNVDNVPEKCLKVDKYTKVIPLLKSPLSDHIKCNKKSLNNLDIQDIIDVLVSLPQTAQFDQFLEIFYKCTTWLNTKEIVKVLDKWNVYSVFTKGMRLEQLELDYFTSYFEKIKNKKIWQIIIDRIYISDVKSNVLYVFKHAIYLEYKGIKAILYKINKKGYLHQMDQNQQVLISSVLLNQNRDNLIDIYLLLKQFNLAFQLKHYLQYDASSIEKKLDSLSNYSLCHDNNPSDDFYDAISYFRDLKSDQFQKLVQSGKECLNDKVIEMMIRQNSLMAKALLFFRQFHFFLTESTAIHHFYEINWESVSSINKILDYTLSYIPLLTTRELSTVESLIKRQDISNSIKLKLLNSCPVFYQFSIELQQYISSLYTNDCPICMEPLNTKSSLQNPLIENAIVTTTCLHNAHHVFHYHCFQKAILASAKRSISPFTCPLCRFQMTSTRLKVNTLLPLVDQ